jgi:hypothetical protein
MKRVIETLKKSQNGLSRVVAASIRPLALLLGGRHANDGCSPGRRAAIQLKREDRGVFFQDSMNRSSKDTLSFAVNDSYFIDSFFEACIEILIDKRGYLLWVEGVEVKDAVDGYMDHVVDIIVQRRLAPFVIVSKQSRELKET